MFAVIAVPTEDAECRYVSRLALLNATFYIAPFPLDIHEEPPDGQVGGCFSWLLRLGETNTLVELLLDPVTRLAGYGCELAHMLTTLCQLEA